MTLHINYGFNARNRAAFAAVTCGFISLLGARVFGEVPGNQVFSGDSGSVALHQYELVNLGTLGGPNSRATAMSDRGAIVGWSEIGLAQAAITPPPIHAFLWFGGVMQDIGTLGGNWAEARGVNSARQVVGSALNAAGQQRAFYFYEAMYDLNDLIDIGQVPGDYGSAIGFVPAPQLYCASAINNAGQVVACGTVSTDNLVHGYLLTPIEPFDLDAPSFHMQDLGAIPPVAVAAPGNQPNSQNPSQPSRDSVPGDLPDIGDQLPGNPLTDLLADWGRKDSAWDLDGDGVVGVTDLLILLQGMADFGREIIAAGNTGNELYAGGYDSRAFCPDEPSVDGAADGKYAGVPGTGEFSFGSRFDRSRQPYQDLDSPSVPVAAGNGGNELYAGGFDSRAFLPDEPSVDGAADGKYAGVPGTGEFSFGSRFDRSRQPYQDLDSPSVPVAAGNGNSPYDGGVYPPGVPGVPDFNSDCIARDINGAATIVGSVNEQAFAWTEGVPILIEVSANTSAANAVNELGQIAGWTMTPNGPMASLWTNGRRSDLATRAGWISEALDVNDFGHAVGWSAADKDGADAAACLWVDGALMDLTRVTIALLTVDFTQVEEAVAIDELERIAASYRTADGRTVASLLIPLD